MQASIYLHIQVADPPPWFPLTQPPVIGMQVKIKICVTIVFSSHEPIWNDQNFTEKRGGSIQAGWVSVLSWFQVSFVAMNSIIWNKVYIHIKDCLI